MKQLVLAITFIIALLIFILLAPIDEAISQTRQKKNLRAACETT